MGFWETLAQWPGWGGALGSIFGAGASGLAVWLTFRTTLADRFANRIGLHWKSQLASELDLGNGDINFVSYLDLRVDLIGAGQLVGAELVLVGCEKADPLAPGRMYLPRILQDSTVEIPDVWRFGDDSVAFRLQLEPGAEVAIVAVMWPVSSTRDGQRWEGQRMIVARDSRWVTVGVRDVEFFEGGRWRQQVPRGDTLTRLAGRKTGKRGSSVA